MVKGKKRAGILQKATLSINSYMAQWEKKNEAYGRP